MKMLLSCCVSLHDGFPPFNNCPQGYHFCQTLHDYDKLMSLSFLYTKNILKTMGFSTIYTKLRYLQCPHWNTWKYLLHVVSLLLFNFKLILLYQLNLTTLNNRQYCFPIFQKGVTFSNIIIWINNGKRCCMEISSLIRFMFTVRHMYPI